MKLSEAQLVALGLAYRPGGVTAGQARRATVSRLHRLGLVRMHRRTLSGSRYYRGKVLWFAHITPAGRHVLADFLERVSAVLARAA